MHQFLHGEKRSDEIQLINRYGNKLPYVGKIAANAALGGCVSVLGGGKFANGAMTAAYTMMFNDLMHQDKEKRQSYKETFMGQVPLDIKVGMQTAAYTIATTVTSIQNSYGLLSVDICGMGTNSYVEGSVTGAFGAELVANGKIIERLPLVQHYKYYITDSSRYTNFIGEASFKRINANLYDSIKVVVKGNWIVRDSSGSGWSVPINFKTKFPIYYKHTYIIK